jgi:hypothetical protein
MRQVTARPRIRGGRSDTELAAVGRALRTVRTWPITRLSVSVSQGERSRVVRSVGGSGCIKAQNPSNFRTDWAGFTS